MSPDEQHQIYGRIMTEYLQTKQVLVALEAEAKSIGSILADIGQTMSISSFITDNFEKRMQSYPEPEKILELAAEISSLRKKKQDAEKQLKEIGFEVKT
jgi:hypothetical protein